MGKRASAKEASRFQPGDQLFLSGVNEAEMVDSSPRASWAIYLMLTAVLTALVWSGVARVDEVTRAEGRIVPDGREQVIASLEGGILRSLLVREGTRVEQGQPLLMLDPTRVEAQQNEGQAKWMSLKASVARLDAEASGHMLHFPAEVAAEASVRQAEMEVFDARRQALEEAVGVSRRSLGLVNKELGMAERMASRGLMSEVEVMRLRRQGNDLQLQIQERINRFRQDASTELAKARVDLAQIEEQMVVKRDVMQRTTINSPVQGFVKSIKLGTVGGVVPAGATIMEIVPMGSRVLVEARIKPSDVGFVRVGLPVDVKLKAYDYYTYGGLKGTIEYLSPDALGEESKTVSTDNTYYRAVIRTDSSSLKSAGKPLEVMPGMTASIEIRTGDRSVLQFLLKPVLKSQEAFRER